jgi:hypothetical protein
MKKLLIIAVVSSFLFISCTKDAPTQPVTNQAAQSAPQNSTFSGDASKPAPPQSYTITNTEINWGVVEYTITYMDSDYKKQTVSLPMGKSITLCIIYGSLQTNFAYTMVALGNC